MLNGKDILPSRPDVSGQFGHRDTNEDRTDYEI